MASGNQVRPIFGHEQSSESAANSDVATQQSLLRSMAEEGDIILPLELCVLRRGETFKQWTARAKRCSIQAARRRDRWKSTKRSQAIGPNP